MAERWVEGAIHDPGVNAGNRLTAMQFCVMHFTAGRDSRNIGKNGYFNALYPKEGQMIQYAGLDELTWNSGPWNPYGPGLEFERLTADEPLTPDQEFWGGVTATILNRDYGIPLEHYQGPRFQAGNFHGFVNHGDLDDQRSDGVTQDEFEHMFDHNAKVADRKGEVVMLYHDTQQDKWYHEVAGGMMQVDKGMAYTMAISGAIVVDNLASLTIAVMGLRASKILQDSLKRDVSKVTLV